MPQQNVGRPRAVDRDATLPGRTDHTPIPFPIPITHFRIPHSAFPRSAFRISAFPHFRISAFPHFRISASGIRHPASRIPHPAHETMTCKASIDRCSNDAVAFPNAQKACRRVVRVGWRDRWAPWMAPTSLI